MRIGIVCPYDLASPGGVQQLCIELAERLRSAGDEAILIGAGSTAYAGGPGVDETTVPVGRPFRIRANDSVVPLTLAPKSWNRVSSALGSVDVVNVHEPLIPMAGWAGLRSRKPKVLTFHADAPSWARTAYRKIPGLARQVTGAQLTAVSSTAAASIPSDWGVPRIIPNAIDVGAYDLPVGRVANRIAFLGRDEPRKGLDIALAAFEEVRQSNAAAELVVMGAERPVAPPGVRYLGRVSDGEKHRMLASSAIFVAPNTGGESFGIVLAEAMAAGCAVVASDLDAFVDVVADNGVTFPTGNAVALARHLVDLLSDEERRGQLGVEAQRAVLRFDWARVLEQYRTAYAAALNAG